MTTRDYALCLASAILLLVSCSPTRHLKDNKHLLVEVELKGVEKVKPENIEALYRQSPNLKIPLLNFYPKLEVYYFGVMFWDPEKIQGRIDKTQEKFAARIAKAGNDSVKVERLVEQRNTKIERLENTIENGNFFMRNLGEPPSIYDSTETLKTQEQIGIYLQSKGFFQNEVSFSHRFKKKRAYVSYQIKEGPPYVYDKVSSQIDDEEVKQLVASDPGLSHIKEGGNFDEAEIEKERNRLTQLLRNNGYYFFNKRFIYFDVDTSFGGLTVRPTTIIENPSDSSEHHTYRLRNIYFVTDASVSRFGVSRDTIAYKGIKYAAYSHNYRPRVLARKVAIQQGQLYSYQNTINTQRQLSDLGTFRYTNVTYTVVPDSANHQLDAYITVHPIERYQLTDQLGLSVREQLPGPFLNLRLLMRNVTGGAEILEFGIRGGYEGVYSRTESKGQYSRELGGNIALTVPRFVTPFNRFELLVKNTPRTRFNIGYTYVDRPDYTRTNAEFSLQYIWRSGQFTQHLFSPFDVNVIETPRIGAEFKQILEEYSQSQSLLRSFQSNLVTAMNYTFLFNNNDLAQTRNAVYLRGFLEVGGLLNRFTEDVFLTNLNRFQYAKIEGDFRRYIPRPNERLLAFRAHAGVAHPFGPVKSVPYEEYFFAGGASSVRAWRPRRLGPGSSAPQVITTETGTKIVDAEQPGEVILEGNAEYRFPVFGFIKGAFFIDGGNVWTLSPDISADRSGAEFGKDFYREIAIGTGLGIRFDFTFLILRVDIGTRVYDPLRPEGEKNIQFKPFAKEQTAVHFGIGYPF